MLTFLGQDDQGIPWEYAIPHMIDLQTTSGKGVELLQVTP